MVFLGNAFSAESDPRMDSALLHLMETYHVPVAGYAIIDHYQIVAANTLSMDPKILVTKDLNFRPLPSAKVLRPLARFYRFRG